MSHEDRNTEFFHRFANFHRQKNSIWEIHDSVGTKLQTQDAISRAAFSYFESAFAQTPSGDPKDLLWGVSRFPLMFGEEANIDLIQPQRKFMLSYFLSRKTKARALMAGLWKPLHTSFAHFFDLFKLDLVNLVEESGNLGLVHPLLNSSYIALIPKKKSPLTFSDFRPISLSNVVYKIISKTIANRLKPILSNYISLPNNMAFLRIDKFMTLLPQRKNVYIPFSRRILTLLK